VSIRHAIHLEIIALLMNIILGMHNWEGVLSALGGLVRLELPMRSVAATVPTLVAVIIALASPPAMSQGAAISGAPMASQPRTAPEAKVSVGASQGSASTPLSGVVATLTFPSGARTRRAITNREGVLSLGSLSQGTYDIAIELPRAGMNQERQQVLVGVLVPTARTLMSTAMQTVSLKGWVRVVVGSNDEPRIFSMDGSAVTHEGAWDANKFGAPSGRDVRLIFMNPGVNSKP
jgi:hypothetical protein